MVIIIKQGICSSEKSKQSVHTYMDDDVKEEIPIQINLSLETSIMSLSIHVL